MAACYGCYATLKETRIDKLLIQTTKMMISKTLLQYAQHTRSLKIFYIFSP